MHAIVHAADIQDRDGGTLLMATLFSLYPFLLKLYADGGYQGAGFQNALRTILKRVNVEIVKRSDQAQRFVVLPKRWLVERTFAWLGRCRRLAKDFENLNRKALAFLRLASIRLMLRKLCNPTGCFRTDSKSQDLRSVTKLIYLKGRNHEDEIRRYARPCCGSIRNGSSLGDGLLGRDNRQRFQSRHASLSIFDIVASRQRCHSRNDRACRSGDIFIISLLQHA